MFASDPQFDLMEDADQQLPIFVDNVLPTLQTWRDEGQRTTLVTFVNREGAAPRPIGAQMAVSETGLSVGYIASDCLGEAIIREALDVIDQASFRVVRYGVGSKYIDLKLPCGSGIDLYFDSCVSDELINKAILFYEQRQAFQLTLDIGEGTSSINPWVKDARNGFGEKNDKQFHRSYYPALRLFIAGTGPGVFYLAQFARAAGFGVHICSSDKLIVDHLQNAGFTVSSLEQASEHINSFVDEYTASVLMFHEHDLEIPILSSLLRGDSFYIGAMGSKNAHAARLTNLQSKGIFKNDLQRIKGPIGAIPDAKNPPQMAVSILAEITQKAVARSFLC